MALHKKHTAMTRAEHEALSSQSYATHIRGTLSTPDTAGEQAAEPRRFFSKKKSQEETRVPKTQKRKDARAPQHKRNSTQDSSSASSAPQGSRATQAQTSHTKATNAPNLIDEQVLNREHAGAYYAAKRKLQAKKTLLRRIGITLASLLGAASVACAIVIGYLFFINSQITSKITDDLRAVLTDSNNNEPYYALLLGIDKDEDRAGSKFYGSSSSAYRSDTIILVRVDPKNKKVTLVSIPRDTWVDMGKNGKQKINAAYSFGGAAYATEVISKFSGLKISHYAEVDMDGFASVVDSIGGVDVDLPVPVKDPKYTKIDLPAGKQHLDGHTAALLGRSRHAYDKYGDGDTYRAANQRMLIGAVMKKVLSSGPTGIANSITTMANYVTCDMSVADIISQGTKFAGMDVSKDIYSGQCPTTSKYINNTWYEILDTPKWQKMIDRINKGLPPYDSDAQNTAQGIAGSVGISSDAEGATQNNPSDASDQEVYEGTVAVLNASGKDGTAKAKADVLVNKGFSASPGNARKLTKTTQVFYTEGAQAKARAVVKSLGIAAKPQKNEGQYNSGTDVVVILGKDILD